MGFLTKQHGGLTCKIATRILLLRHGATDPMTVQLSGRLAGVGLNATGVEQARALAGRLPNLDRLVSSPLQRATETAAALRRQVETDPSFTEFDFGEWTGVRFSDLQDDPLWKRFNEQRDLTRAPGGESMEEVQERAIAGLQRILLDAPGKTIGIVTHADVIRALVLRVTGTPIRHFWRLQIGPASITELLCGPEGDERIVRMNDCAHLENLQA